MASTYDNLTTNCKPRFRLIETTAKSDGLEKIPVFGIEYSSMAGENHAVCRFEDISSVKEKVEKLLNLLEENDVAECHLKDIVEDFILD